MERELFVLIASKIESLETEVNNDYDEYINSIPDYLWDMLTRHISITCYQSLLDESINNRSIFPPRCCLH